MDKIFVSREVELPEIKPKNIKQYLLTRHYTDKELKNETKYRHLCFRFPCPDAETIGKIIGIMQKNWRDLGFEPRYLLTKGYFDCEYVFKVYTGGGETENCIFYAGTVEELTDKISRLKSFNIQFKMGEHWFDYLNVNVFEITSREHIISNKS